MRGFLIAGTNSGCGKTTISMGLMTVLSRKGYRLASFKTGPDFIDPMFHAIASNSTSYNLDSYLLSEDTIKYLFKKHTFDKDIAVVEGVMGLFDGLGDNAHGSTAELAKILNIPVILVVSCKGLYQSVAAIVAGFKNFDSSVRVAGVILNHVSSEDQFAQYKRFIEHSCNVMCIGYLPYISKLNIESRHLGLVQASEISDLEEKLAYLSATLEQTIDVDKLLAIANDFDVPSPNTDIAKMFSIDLSNLRLGVAMDTAFQFYYRDNIELLQENGAQITYFSPLSDAEIPDFVTALYIGGGYPEVFADTLSSNSSLMTNLQKMANFGMPMYAECGGLMYLTASISNLDDTCVTMSSVFNATTELTTRLQRFGYCTVEWDGVETKAHEFHRSRIIEPTEKANYSLSFNVSKPEKNKTWKCGLQRNSVLAAYPHIHFYSNDDFFKKIMQLWMKKTI